MPDTIPASAIAGLLLAAQGLRDLAGWYEVASLTERALDAARGGEGLDPWDVARLRTWPARWRMVRPEVRTFYRAALAHNCGEGERAAISCGLLAHLDGRRPEDHVRGRMARLFVEITGEEAGFPLCPG